MTNAEDFFIPFFQKNISIILESKTLRQGKLLLFCVKDFYLNFTLLHNGVSKVFELPYPFDTYLESLTSSVLVLDYKYRTLTRNLDDIEFSSRPLLSKSKHMKYFDNTIKIIES